MLLARFGDRWLAKVRREVSLVDGVSLGLFVAVGMRISEERGLPPWACVVHGVITATFEGVPRDIARAEVPLIFRKEIYATACIIGGFSLLGLDRLGVPDQVAVPLVAVLVRGIRIVAIRFAVHPSSE